MEIKNVTVMTLEGLKDFVIVEFDNGTGYSMPKSVWDAQQDAETL